MLEEKKGDCIKNKLIKGIIVLIPILAFLFLSTPVSGQESVGFSVEAQLPENQVNEQYSYFNLRVKPGQEQEIETLIHNHENEKITVQVSAYNASTNSNGLVVYKEQEEVDPSLENPITDIVTLEETEVTIPAGESVSVAALLTMPEESFEGIKLGGFHFERVMEDEESGEGVNIQNRYAYIIGLQLSEKDDIVTPELHFNSVVPSLVNHRTAIVANIQNSEPVLIEGATLQAQVFEENGSEPINETYLENVNIAPNSNMDVVVDWQNQPLVEGDYRLELQISDGTNDWEWIEKFNISVEDESLNEEAVELEEENNYIVWFIIGFGLLIVIIIFLLIYIKKLKSRND